MDSFRNELINLIEQKEIAPERVNNAIELSQIKPTPSAWLTLLNQLFLWAGCVALGCSVIFFVAYNWSSIGRLAKFALVESALVLSVVVYLKTQVGSMASRAAITLSVLILGALMALFGQTYQTGADPWQLFFNWALLAAPWVIIARFTPLWLMWVGLINLSIILYCDANPHVFSIIFDSNTAALWLVFIYNALSFFVWNKLSSFIVWMQQPWAIRVLATAAGGSITMLAFAAIIDNTALHTFALPIWAVCLCALYVFYRKLHTDLFMLAGGCLSGIVITVTFLAKEILSHGDSISFLLLAIIVIGLGTAAAFWLKKVQQEAQV